MPRGWEGKRIRLVPLDKERHFDNAVEWINDPDVTEWTLIGDMPITRVGEEEFFDRVMKPSEKEVAFAIELLDGEHIGFTGLHQIERHHGVAISGTLIGRKDLWRQGYGTEVAEVRTRYAFDVLGMRMLLSEVLDGNHASLKALTKVGYREVARIPARYWKRGAHRDAIYLAVFREEWLERPRA